jgi:hypothetical protein
MEKPVSSILLVFSSCKAMIRSGISGRKPAEDMDFCFIYIPISAHLVSALIDKYSPTAFFSTSIFQCWISTFTLLRFSQMRVWNCFASTVWTKTSPLSLPIAVLVSCRYDVVSWRVLREYSSTSSKRFPFSFTVLLNSWISSATFRM